MICFGCVAAARISKATDFLNAPRSMYLREFGAEVVLDRVELALQAGDSSVHVRHRPRVGAMLVVDARLQVLAHL